MSSVLQSATVATAVTVLLAVAATQMLLRGRRLRQVGEMRQVGGLGRERFELLAPVNMAKARSGKSMRYANAALKYFYSSGASGSVTAEALFFHPSVNDIICRLGSASLQQNCDPKLDWIDHISCEDTTMRPSVAQSCSLKSTRVASSPSQQSDCTVRVMDRYYRFSKTCLTLRVLPYNKSNAGIMLRQADGVTALAVLSRPMFLALTGGRLRAVSYERKPGAVNQLCDFDSSRPVDTLVQLSDAAGLSDDGGLQDPDVIRNLQAAVGAVSNGGSRLNGYQPAPASAYTEHASIYATLYYLAFDGTRQLTARSAEAGGQRMVLSLYFDLVATPSPTFSDPALLVTVVGGKAEAKPGGSQVVCAIPLPANAKLLVVTYATDLIIMCALSATRAVIRHFPGQQKLSINDNVRAKAASYAMPASLSQAYSNGCIPNFADLALRYGFAL